MFIQGILGIVIIVCAGYIVWAKILSTIPAIRNFFELDDPSSTVVDIEVTINARKEALEEANQVSKALNDGVDVTEKLIDKNKEVDELKTEFDNKSEKL
jgi:hypothetical protein